MTDTTKNFSRQLGWRGRHSWRRTARSIVAEHVEELLSRLKGLYGPPICGLATSATGTVRLMVPGWAITVTDVAPGAQAALTAAVEQPHCHLADAGRVRKILLGRRRRPTNGRPAPNSDLGITPRPDQDRS
jgi:hypothetical protein